MCHSNESLCDSASGFSTTSEAHTASVSHSLAQVIHSLLNEHVDRPNERTEPQIASLLDAADERGPAGPARGPVHTASAAVTQWCAANAGT
jgi:hypothetical protein